VGQPYTYGVWVTKPGHEEEFIVGWRDLAEWTKANAAGAGWARLLRDAGEPNRFVTIGPWKSSRDIEAWRALPGFQERVARLRPLLESFTPANLDLCVEVGFD
jgi:quinol monooxygenase YgiN